MASFRPEASRFGTARLEMSACNRLLLLMSSKDVGEERNIAPVAAT